MNIVVIGGGTPGRFGNDFCNRARSEGHDVYVISHVDHHTNDPRHIVSDFSKPDVFLNDYKKLIEQLDRIDIFLYNTTGGSGAWHPSELQSTGVCNVQEWEVGLKLHVIVPHMLILESLKKMNDTSGIVFMTTEESYKLTKTFNTHFVGYAGFKGMQNHLMIGLSQHNDKKAIVTSVSTHLPYENKHEYDKLVGMMYEYITTLTQENNGKIRCFRPNNPMYIN